MRVITSPPKVLCGLVRVTTLIISFVSSEISASANVVVPISRARQQFSVVSPLSFAPVSERISSFSGTNTSISDLTLYWQESSSLPLT